MEEDNDLPLSKTKRKQQMIELQKLGERLVTLSPEQLQRLPLPEALRDAVLEAKRLRAFGALSRQMQYIGKLMRDTDPEPIRAKFDELDGESRESTAHLHQLERWRERLLDDDKALAELIEQYPAADRQRLRTLIMNARKEMQAERPPKAKRALFRELRALMEEGTAASEPDSDED